MSFLTEKEIMALLDTLDPDEIMAKKKDELDQAGRQLLEELSQDIQAGQEIFEEYGRRFRETDAESEDPDRAEKTTPSSDAWFRRSIKMPHWALVAAAVLAGVAVLPTLLDWSDPTRTRGRSASLAEIQPINDELVAALIKRGEFLMELGIQKNSRDYFKEARNDLIQAYELDPKNIKLLNLLARIHEKLGQDKQAEKFLQEWRAAKTEQSE